MQKNVQWSNTNFINIPSNANTANELAAEKAKAQALENKHIALANEKASLEGKHNDLNKVYEDLKIKLDNKEIEQEDTTGTTEDSSNDNKDKEDGGKLEFSNKKDEVYLGFLLAAQNVKVHIF